MLCRARIMISRTKLTYKALLCLCAAYAIYKITIYLIWGRYGSNYLSQIVIFAKDQKEATVLLRDRQISQSSPVINPHPYKFLINEPNKCQNEDGSNKPVFLLILVTTIHKKVELRKAVRETWASPSEINGQKIITLFLLAKPDKRNIDSQDAVDKESALHHDIIMGDFQDSYKNLTLKTMMGMKWVSQFCPHAEYVMKTDDDMIVMYENLVRFLSSPAIPSRNFVSCNVIRAKVNRNWRSKWYVPESVYPGEWYPPFCSGSGYVLSGDVAINVYAVSLHTPFLYLEDVFMGLCLFQLGVTPSTHRQFHNYDVQYSLCKYKKLFTTHYKDPSKTIRYDIWRSVKEDKRTYCFFHFW